MIAVPCADATELTALVYHDIPPDPVGDPYSVSRSMFLAQMDYLKQNGYQPVSLGLLVRAQAGKARLPEKPVLLTFDDALRSYGEFVTPLLKHYGFPSVVSVVGVWADGTRTPPEYQGRLMTWDDLRKLRHNPLVEIISHSHDLHRGIPSNPQGNEAAAGTTRRYSKETRTYESETEFRQRIRDDLTQSVAEFKRHLGFAPRAIAWPYGYYDQVLIEEMARAGMQLYLTMDNGPTALKQLPRIKRVIVRNTPSLVGFIDDLQYKYRLANQRVVEFSLDPFKEISEAKQEELLSQLLDRLQVLGANTVLVSPFTADRREAFFQNRQLPVAANVLNRVLHQLLTRLRIQRIYLSIPASVDVKDMEDLYTDMARLSWFSGVVFESAPVPETETRIRRVMSYYHPIMKFGLEDAPLANHRYDFKVLSLPADLSRKDIEARINPLRNSPIETLVVLGWTQQEGDRELAARLGLLRGLGVKHYGYGPDNYADASPAQYLVSPEMSGKPVAAAEK